MSAGKRFASESSLKMMEQSSLHITLNFVGDVEDREIPGLCKAFTKALESVEPFRIELSGFGGFPNLECPRVLWTGVDEGTESLIDINEKFKNIIEDFGFLQEKRYSPHITIARTQHRDIDSDIIKRIQSSFERMQFDAFRAKSVVVFNSLQEKKGPTYIPLATLPM